MKQVVFINDPVNKLASIVTNQSGCSKTSECNAEQLRENLVSILKSLEKKIQSYPKNHPQRRVLGKAKAETQEKIHQLRPRKKAPGVEHYFIDTAREFLTKEQFNIVMTRAVENMRKDKQCRQK